MMTTKRTKIAGSLPLLRENTDFAFFLYYDIPDLYVFQKREKLIFSSETSPEGYVVFQGSPTVQVELLWTTSQYTVSL